jgi:hemolysin activation/secretion protein
MAKFTRTVLIALGKYVAVNLHRYQVKYTAPWGRQDTSFNATVARNHSAQISVKQADFQNTQSI